MRTASPPTDVGRICPAAYDTRYARVSHGMVSSTPFARSRSCQRQAIGRIVTIISASAISRYHGFASAITRSVLPRSIFQIR
jgi:hypothetical protein